MWIKICGNTNLEDVRWALDAGADAVGFVFAPSPRQVTEAQVGAIVASLPPETETYGVFVDSTPSEIAAAAEVCGLTGVQIHADHPHVQIELRERFAAMGRPLKILSVVRWGHTGSFAGFAEEVQERGRYSDAVLVDSFSLNVAGGSGESFDWEAARKSFSRARPLQRLVLAGGLRPETVSEAISILRPWGVDVASGVEARPGKKDRARLAAFVRAAREARPLRLKEAGEEEVAR